ncbi:MAG: hypothetical protein ACQ9IQ_11785 [Nitrospirales bacterium]
MIPLKPFLLTATSLVLFAGLFTPVSSQIITRQPPSGNVTVLSAPSRVATPFTAPPPVSPNIIPGQPPVSPNIIPRQPTSRIQNNVRDLNSPLRIVTPTGAPPSVSPQAITTQPASLNVTVLNDPLPVETPTGVRTPIQIQDSGSNCGPGECSVQLLTVPTGKRLVVEYLAATTRILPAGTSGASASILLLTKFGGESQTIHVGLTDNNGPGPNSNDVLGEVVKLYAASDTDVICRMVVPNFENIDFFNCSITGFLEDVT